MLRRIYFALLILGALVTALAACEGDGRPSDPTRYYEEEPNERVIDAAYFNSVPHPQKVNRIFGELEIPDDPIDVFRFVSPAAGLTAEASSHRGDIAPQIFIREVGEDMFPIATTMAGPVASFDVDLVAGKSYDLGVSISSGEGAYRIDINWR